MEPMERAVRDDQDGTGNATFELVAGTAAAVVVAGFAAAALFPAPGPAGRVVVMAVAVGLCAAVATDWRAAAGVAVLAALVFVGFLTHRYGVLTGDPSPWSRTPLLGLATVLGRGYRGLTHATPQPRPRAGEEFVPSRPARSSPGVARTARAGRRLSPAGAGTTRSGTPTRVRSGPQ
jgi:hypothetical protein